MASTGKAPSELVELCTRLLARNPEERPTGDEVLRVLSRDLRDEHSHAVLTGHVPADHHLLNFQNKFIALANKGPERSVVLSVNREGNRNCFQLCGPTLKAK